MSNDPPPSVTGQQETVREASVHGLGQACRALSEKRVADPDWLETRYTVARSR